MDAAAARQQLVRIGAAMQQRRLVVAAEGNLSVRLGGDRFLTTPRGVAKGELAGDDLVEVDLAGRSADPARAASSEWGLHAEIYRRCPDAGAICHGHPAHATACAAAGVPLDHRILIETAAVLGPVPLCRPAVAGTPDVARSVAPHLPRAKGLLLGGHGAVAWAADPTTALWRLESIERLAEVTLLARLAGGARPLPPQVLRQLGCEPAGDDPDPGNSPR
jgi:L-fuculose-phosphate aldolase